MNIRINLLSTLLCLMSFSAFAEDRCTYELGTDKSETKYTNITEFVVKEIRPKLGGVPNEKFEIQIKQSCPGIKTFDNKNPDNIIQRVNLTMLSGNYYIVEINGQKLPDYLVKYNSKSGLDINRGSFDSLISETNKYKFDKFPEESEVKTYNDLKDKLIKQRILKMYAFVFAEAARFESIEAAVHNSIEGNCSKSWHDFNYTVHNWRNMSDFISAKHIKTKNQLQNGALIAPIYKEQELFFDERISAGEPFKYSLDAPMIDSNNIYICRVYAPVVN